MSVLFTTSTDDRGRALVDLRYGTVAGDAWIAATAPEFGISDTARYSTTSGNPTLVRIAPRDTALYVERLLRVSSQVFDRYNNTVAQTPTFSVSGGNLLFIGSDQVTGTSIGVGIVHSTLSDVKDSIFVYVVPQGRLSAATTFGVVAFNTDGSGRQIFGSGWVLTTAWSRDGNEIAFDLGGSGIHIVNSAGQIRPATSGGVELYPEFSHDDQRVYFTRDPWSVWSVSRLGGDEELAPLSESGYTGAPTLSPDGTRMIFVRIRGNADDSLSTMHMANGAVTHFEIRGHTPRWSPTGDLVAYLVQPTRGIGLIQPDGSGQRHIGNPLNMYGFGMGWSPDGEWVVAQNESKDVIELINVETGLILPLPFTAGMRGPSWRP